MTPAQCRAGRALLDLTVAQLARLARQPSPVVFHFERGRRVLEMTRLAAIKAALELAGVEFVEDGVLPVRMKRA